jgi:hypothetical protein
MGAHIVFYVFSLSSFSVSLSLRELRRRVHYHQYVVLMNQPSSSERRARALPPPLARNISSPERASALWVTRLQRHTELYCIVHWGGTKPIWITLCVAAKQRKNDERERRTSTLMMMLLCENFFIVNQVSFIKRTELVI